MFKLSACIVFSYVSIGSDIVLKRLSNLHSSLAVLFSVSVEVPPNDRLVMCSPRKPNVSASEIVLSKHAVMLARGCCRNVVVATLHVIHP